MFFSDMFNDTTTPKDREIKRKILSYSVAWCIIFIILVIILFSII
jgi:hypothetical protein